MDTPKPLSVAIAGGGISGLCLAIGLLSQPHLKISIFEAARAFSEIGAGLIIGPNAQRALALISPLAERAFLNQATPNCSPEYKNTFFEFLYGKKGEREGEVLARVENTTGQQTVHRAKFLDELVRLIPDGLAHFDKRLIRVEELGGDKGLVLWFADGSSARADCLFGADGIHSSVRKHILGATDPTAQPVFTGTVAYRGLIPMDVARENVGEFAADARIWCGTGGIITTYPIDFGKTLNVVAIRDGIPSWDHPNFITPVDEEKCRREYSSWGDIPTKILNLLTPSTMWAIPHHLPAPYYNSGNIAIMGDAAHASTPFQSAGVSQAIEDALVLSTLFQDVKSIQDITPALASYDAVRCARSQKVVETSRETMDLFSFSDEEVGGNAELRRKVWDGRMDWIWDVDPVKQNEMAVKMFRKAIEGSDTASEPLTEDISVELKRSSRGLVHARKSRPGTSHL